MPRIRMYEWSEGRNPRLVKSAALNRFNAKPKPHAHVVGIDLSLRAAAACAIPSPWDHDLEKIRMLKAGYALDTTSTAKERVERIAQLAHDISVFCLNVKAFRVGIEDYAFSKSSAHQHQTFEAGGALKVAVLELLDLAIYPVTAATARKTLLGVVPRLGAGKTKPWVVRNVRRLGGPAAGWTDDECDAFVVANRVLADAGGVAMSFDGE